MPLTRAFPGNSLTIPVVLPAHYVERLNVIASDRRISRSGLIRQLIEGVLFGAGVAKDDVKVGDTLANDGAGEVQP